MKSNVRIGRRPIHPYLVLLPVGAFVAALVFDLTYLNSGNPHWRALAYWNIMFGVVTALIAAVVGLVDLTTLRMRDEARSEGWTHGILNVTIVALFIINLVLRARTNGALSGSPLTWSTILTIVPTALLLYSGWLGLDLVFHWGVSVPEETIENIPPLPSRGTARIATSGSLGGEFPPRDQEHKDNP